MKTGEGKTLVATCPVYLNALAEKGVHVITVNDYLAKRDRDQMSRLYGFFRIEFRSYIKWTSNRTKKKDHMNQI